jgi:hypothetical protein
MITDIVSTTCSITLSMHGDADHIELRSAIAGYYRARAARLGAPTWTGELDNQNQARIHARISRRPVQRLFDRAAL